MSDRWLPTTLKVTGATALVMGAHGVVTGTRGVLDSGGAATANVDSEFRFFAAWYAAAGYLTLKAARRPEASGPTIRALSGAWLLAFIGRLLSARSIGKPHPFFRLLGAAELSLAFGLAAGQRSMARTSTTSPSVTGGHRSAR